MVAYNRSIYFPIPLRGQESGLEVRVGSCPLSQLWLLPHSPGYSSAPGCPRVTSACVFAWHSSPGVCLSSNVPLLLMTLVTLNGLGPFEGPHHDDMGKNRILH